MIVPTLYNAFAEQFTNPKSVASQTPKEMLCRARMILVIEVRKDPLLLQSMLNLFKTKAQISVQPTDLGVNKIDKHHPHFLTSFVAIKRFF